MLTERVRDNFFGIAVISLFIFAWFYQNLFLLNSDDSFLIHCTQLLLQGGHYGTHFLETNPPLILYLYMPCVFLISHFHLSVDIALRIYIFTLAVISLVLCARLLKTFLQDNILYSTFLLCLAFIYVVLPAGEFGQREHITLLFVMPYLLLITARLEKFDPQSLLLLINIGVLAGLGFSLKPFFFIALALVEIYFYFRAKKLWLFRAETLSLGITVLAYLGMIVLFHQNYLKIILPLITPVYYTWYTTALHLMMTTDASVMVCFTMGFFLVCYGSLGGVKNLASVLLLASVGFWISYVLQRIDWYYHELPHFSLDILLVTLIFSRLLSLQILSKKLVITLLIFLCSLVAYVYFYQAYIFSNLSFPFFPEGFFGLLTCVLLLIFSRLYSLARNSLSVIFIILSSVCFYNYMLHSIYHQYVVALTFTLFLLLSALFLPHQTLKTLCRGMLFLFLGLLLYVGPFYRLSFVSAYSHSHATHYENIISRMQPYQNTSTYYFTNMSELIYPMINYAKQHYVSRFWSLVWLPVMREPKNFIAYGNFYQEHLPQLTFYLQAIEEDFQKYKPEIVFVDDRVHSQHLYYGAMAPDYLRLLEQDVAFQQLWKHYAYVETIDEPPLCRIKVYKRETY